MSLGADGRAPELERRNAQWNALVAAGGPSDVPASLLQSLRIYRGMRGIWVDKKVTSAATDDGVGVTVSLLASEGGPYPDDLAQGRYEYPRTRLPSWDAASIEATKNAKRMQLPVFLVLRHSGAGSLRSVRRVSIVDWNDKDHHFVLTPFREDPSAHALHALDPKREEQP